MLSPCANSIEVASKDDDETSGLEMSEKNISGDTRLSAVSSFPADDMSASFDDDHVVVWSQVWSRQVTMQDRLPDCVHRTFLGKIAKVV